MPKNSGPRKLSDKVGEHVRIYLREGIWHATWQERGQQRRQSLKTRVKKAAIRRALEIDRRLAAGERPAPRTTATIKAAIEAYLESVAAKPHAEGTFKSYRRKLEGVLELATSMGLEFVSEIDLSFVDQFRIHQKKQKKTCGDVTIHNKLIILRQMVNFAVTRRMVAADPLLGLRLKRPKPTPQPCFDEAQLALILQNSPPEVYPTYLLLTETGLRIGEARWLTWNDIDLKQNLLHVRAKEGWKPKNGDARVVPLTETLRKFLSSAPRNGRWVLTAPPSQRNRSTTRQICRVASLLALKAVLKPLGIRGKHHTFRHSFISRCLLSGIEEAVVRSWAGQVDEKIIRLYTHIASQQSQQRIKRLEAVVPPALDPSPSPKAAG